MLSGALNIPMQGVQIDISLWCCEHQASLISGVPWQLCDWAVRSLQSQRYLFSILAMIIGSLPSDMTKIDGINMNNVETETNRDNMSVSLAFSSTSAEVWGFLLLRGQGWLTLPFGRQVRD